MSLETTLPMGLVHGMQSKVYHADASVSNSMLSSMAKSPAHCYALHLAPDRPPPKTTAAMDLGTLMHCLALEPDELERRYVVRPEGLSFATKDGKAWRDAQTLPIIDASDLATAIEQVKALKRVPAIADLLYSGYAESSLFWTDETTGLRCRARPDWLHWTDENRVVALDLKSIADLTPKSVERAIATYGYHRQRAHYTNGLQACGLDVEAFVFGFVSASYPFLSVAYVFDPETEEQGRDEVAELLQRFAQCMDSGQWPAFGDGYQQIGLPAWARRSAALEVAFDE